MPGKIKPATQQDDFLIKFLIETKDGKYAEIDPNVTHYQRIPDYSFQNYEEEAQIFSYS
jgi:hypothetical protein